MKFLLAFCLFLGGLTPLTADRHTLRVNIQDFRNDQGVVRVVLFDGANGFPDNPVGSSLIKTVKIRDGKAQAVFADLKPGQYAVTLLHDEDQDGKMDKNMMGIPREGYGFSGEKVSKMRAPKFDEARFALRSDTAVQISVIYF